MEHVDYHEYKLETMVDELMLRLRYHKFDTTVNITIERMHGPVGVIGGQAMEACTYVFWSDPKHPTTIDLYNKCVEEIEDDLKHIADKYPEYTSYIYAPFRIGQLEDVQNPNTKEMYTRYFMRRGKHAGPILK
jgi:hypothetical protein